jgi:hypothetical protein
MKATRPAGWIAVILFASLLTAALGDARPVKAAFPTPAAAGWKMEYLDSQRTFNKMGAHSLVFDAANHPHLAYGGQNLYHTWNNGLGWLTEVVDANLDVGWYASMAIDNNGHIHIAYYDAKFKDLRFAWELDKTFLPAVRK